MNIAVLGGSFDPPHNGHLHVAKTLLKNKKCEKVILMPVFKHPFGKLLIEAKHRLAMTKLLTLSPVIPAKLVLDSDRGAGIQQAARFPIRSGMTKNIEVSDIEILKKRTSYSIDTLNTLKKLHPKDDFFWVIGKDQVKDFKKWKGWREIKEKFGLIVVPRSPIDISSSEIRKRVKNGKSIKKFVPKRIENYIIQNKLYLQ